MASRPEALVEPPTQVSREDPAAVAAVTAQALSVGREEPAETAAPPVAYPAAQDRTDTTVFYSTADLAAAAVARVAIARAASPETVEPAAAARAETSLSTGSSALQDPQVPPDSKDPREGRKGPPGR